MILSERDHGSFIKQFITTLLDNVVRLSEGPEILCTEKSHATFHLS